MSEAAVTPPKPARPTVRDHIDALVDPGSFVPANGGEGGEGLIDGRPVTLGYAGHLFERARNRKHPYIAISSGTGGVARGGPRNLGTLDPVWGMSGGPMFPEMLGRLRNVPVVSALVHHSFGDSSFFTGLSDYVVQLRGTCMALTGPRVLAIGTSERVTMEELGGVDVHGTNGQADSIADTLDDVYAAVRRVLSYLPSRGGAPLPVTGPAHRDDQESGLRPAGAGAGGGRDMRQLIGDVCDRRSFFELRRDFAPSLITGLARLGGIPVGLVASDRAVDDGDLSPDACLKATRLVCTCDAFGLPLVFLLDTAGPGQDRPAGRAAPLSRAMMLAQAVQLAQVPKCWVVVGRAAGAGLLITGPARVATDLVVAWPDARAGFYDGSSEAAEWAPDGVITPGRTRTALMSHLRAVLGPSPVGHPGPLRTWPVGF